MLSSIMKGPVFPPVLTRTSRSSGSMLLVGYVGYGLMEMDQIRPFLGSLIYFPRIDVKRDVIKMNFVSRVKISVYEFLENKLRIHSRVWYILLCVS
jgi:hypothetical protein